MRHFLNKIFFFKMLTYGQLITNRHLEKKIKWEKWATLNTFFF